MHDVRAALRMLVTGVVVGPSVACLLLTSLDGLSGEPSTTEDGPPSPPSLPDTAVPDADIEEIAPADGAAPLAQHTCRELHAAYGDLPSGIYMLASGRAHYCEMGTSDGGWTLVGRSVADAGASFGWRVDRGSVTDDTRPYSFDVVGAQLPFDEILVGKYAVGKQLVVAYALAFAATAVAGSGANALVTSDVRTVIGGCAPPGGPLMLRYAGFTNQTTHFQFRDNASGPGTGLYSSGFSMYYANDCPKAGFLDAEQGEIFVR